MINSSQLKSKQRFIDFEFGNSKAKITSALRYDNSIIDSTEIDFLYSRGIAGLDISITLFSETSYSENDELLMALNLLNTYFKDGLAGGAHTNKEILDLVEALYDDLESTEKALDIIEYFRK